MTVSKNFPKPVPIEVFPTYKSAVIYIPAETFNTVRAHALREEQSLSNMCVLLLKRGLKVKNVNLD